MRRRPMVRMARGVTRLFDPPAGARIGPLKEGFFKSRLHDERLSAQLGIALGVTFTICFVTGLLSHLIQYPPAWFTWPPRPAGLYRLSQGVHVATGIASIPLLLAKLWVVYPHFWTWPPVRNVLHLIERISLLPLVGGSIFLLFSGLANIGLWYPWRFFFPAGHYSGAWITIGALIVHIGAKATLTRRVLARDRGRSEAPGDGLSRRGFLGVVGGTAGLLTLLTVGQTFRPLNRLAILAPRRPDVGPQGFPVNKSAASAKITDDHVGPSYRLLVTGAVTTALALSLDDLRALPQHEATLPIACVEGWSAEASWRGVRVAELLQRAGAAPDADVTVESLQASGLYKASALNALQARDPDTLLALEINGETLHIDHGYPVRLIGPNRPGVMQTKWVEKLVVS
nr:molybdopterin-dependent oxidoreductase [Actinomycetota bacterium]